MQEDSRDKQKIVDKIAKLERKLNDCNRAYYDENRSLISDYEYDVLKKELVRLKDENRKLLEEREREISQQNKQGGYNEQNVKNRQGNQIAKGLFNIEEEPKIEESIGYKPNNRFKKIQHKQKMMSLANALTEEEFDEFIKKTNRFLKIESFPSAICELKIDGLSFSAVYSYGKLKYVATRGNGIIGEDVSENVLQIANFPRVLPYVDGYEKQPKDAEIFEVRGEVYMPKSSFLKLNESLEEKDKFSNPRNAASGTLRQLNPEIVKERELGYYAYFIMDYGEEIVKSQSESLILLQKLGFVVNQHWCLAKNTSEIKEFYKKIEKIRYGLECDIDGVVVKINDFDIQKSLGFTATDPRWAIAYKFSGITAITKIIGIKNQVGRTGVITPVAELMPVNIGGVIVKRATLHNYEEIKRLGIAIGDDVVVKRSGDVIPKIVEISTKAEISTEIVAPSVCPCCGSVLVRDERYVAIKCPNEVDCKDKIVDKIKHFSSREGFDVAGLGKQNIICFYDLGFLKKIEDVFNLKDFRDKLVNLDGFGDKSIDNLLNSIEASKNITFNKFLYALGIADVGENVAKILASNYGNIENLLNDAESFEKVKNINGLGEVLIENLVEYFNNSNNLAVVKYLASICHIKEFVVKSGKFTGKSLVFTGTLQSMTRPQAKIKAEECGFKVLTEISGNTDFLVYGENAGSKLKRASDFGIELLTEEEWLKMIDKDNEKES